MAGIFTKERVATGEKDINPDLAFFVFWFLICWLAVLEGGQGALVGLQPIDMALYAESHPRALTIIQLAYKGDNID